MATTYITRTPASNGSDTKFTFSTWVKRGITSAGQEFLFDYYSGGYDQFYFAFNANDTLAWQSYNGGSGPSNTSGETTRKFRDCGAWYHIVLAVDTTLASSGDRIRLYINGVEETVFNSENQPAQDTALAVNQTTETLYIGAEPPTPSGYFTGEMSHVQWVDGAQLTPTEFGSVDATSGIWKIKTSCYATPGTNGFCMKMEDRTNLDLDSSSNAHTFVTSGTGLTATYDNPSNNFATFNPLLVPVSNKPSFANGNTSVTTQDAGGSYFGGTSSLGMVGGKWYCEFKASSLTGNGMVGIHGNPTEQARDGAQTGVIATGYAYMNDGQKKTAAVASSYGTSYTTANVVGVAVDLDNLKIYFARDNTWQDSGDPTSGATGTGAAFTITAADATLGQHYVFSCSDNASGASVWDVNFGNGYFGTTAVTSAEADGAGEGAFEFAPPTGYYALCTKNIKAYGG